MQKSLNSAYSLFFPLSFGHVLQLVLLIAVFYLFSFIADDVAGGFVWNRHTEVWTMCLCLIKKSEIRWKSNWQKRRVQCFVGAISPLRTSSPPCVFFACSLCSGDAAQELGASFDRVRSPRPAAFLLADEGWPPRRSSCWQSIRTGGIGRSGGGGGFAAPSEARVRGQTWGPRVPPLVA